MANMRIQDLNENWKPDTNDNFALTFTGNGESKTRLRDLYYSLVPDGAITHNNIYRGQSLGALTATHIANIRNGSFKDMFIGDYFTINGSTYVIAAINYKHGNDDNIPLGNHLLLMPTGFSKMADGTELRGDGKTTHFMNDTNTTEGGFAGSKMYKTYFPSIQQKLESDFGSNLMKWRGIVSTHVDSSGAPDQGEWRDMKVMIPNEIMIYGTTINGNNKNGGWYNIGDDNVQLPLMRMSSDERNTHRWAMWLRDVHSASEFASAGSFGDDVWRAGVTDIWPGVRAFFLIG